MCGLLSRTRTSTLFSPTDYRVSTELAFWCCPNLPLSTSQSRRKQKNKTEHHRHSRLPFSAKPRRSRPVTSVIFPRTHHRALIMMSFALQQAMDHLGLCLLVQLSLAFGVAGLLWPDKFMPLFDVLMFPWAASYRAVRANSLAAIGLSLVLLVKLFTAAV